MKKTYFIAGTDTGVGKTWVSCALLRAAIENGNRALGLKPIAAGADVKYDGAYENEDAVALKKISNVAVSMRELNPFCVPEPLSPHIAAERAKVNLSVESVIEKMSTALNIQADLCLVEGAGGWRVPINHHETMADLARALDLPIILVVGMRLGCLNHAMLSAESIERDGLKLHGWIANEIDPDMSAVEENIATLNRQLHAPLIARIPNSQKVDGAAPHKNIDISKLFV